MFDFKRPLLSLLDPKYLYSILKQLSQRNENELRDSRVDIAARIGYLFTLAFRPGRHASQPQ